MTPGNSGRKPGDGASSPTRSGGAKNAKGLATGSSKGSPQSDAVAMRTSPAGGVVPGRAVAVSRSANGAMTAGADQPAAGMTSIASLLGKSSGESPHEPDYSLGPLHTRPTPQLPSQRNAARNGHSHANDHAIGGSRITANLQPVNRAINPMYDYSGSHGAEVDDAEGGYTYLPINMNYPGARAPRARARTPRVHMRVCMCLRGHILNAPAHSCMCRHACSSLGPPPLPAPCASWRHLLRIRRPVDTLPPPLRARAASACMHCTPLPTQSCTARPRTACTCTWTCTCTCGANASHAHARLLES